MFCFILGREFRLSIAEIYAVFPYAEFIFVNESFCIVDKISREEILLNYPKMGGSIKVIEIIKKGNDIKNFIEFSYKYLENIGFIKQEKGKINFAIASYGSEKIDNFTVGYQIKKSLKNKNLSIRLVNNSKENINSATYKKEKLSSFECELNYINTGNEICFGKTIIYQDIDKYSKRDFHKFRDMQTGMLPPKLAQMMINISGENIGIYDPFVGLGTIPIEAKNSGYKYIFGSDISIEMVKNTTQNLDKFTWDNKEKFDIKQEYFFQMDASKIQYDLPGNIIDQILNSTIVTEGFLGDIMTKGHITIEKINISKITLKKLYDGFFSGLKKLNFTGIIVISFPFWELNGKYIYFEEIYKLLEKLSLEKGNLLPENIQFKTTKYGSLLYKRNDQQVGREIFKLRF